MVFNPATDFIGLWRNIAGHVSKLEMPGLDYVVAAFARAGLITLSVSATAPVANQSTTVWLDAAVPSYSAEGALFLWNPVTTAYEAATPELFLLMLQATAGQNGVSFWTCTGGAPSNIIGNNGDLAIRTDEPGGVYGPKVAGSWPADPLPGTTDVLSSTKFDETFGDDVGSMIYRAAPGWQALPVDVEKMILMTFGGVPAWQPLETALDAWLSTVRGALIFRGATFWDTLNPGTAGYFLTTGGPGSDPSWVPPPAAEFASGTVMLFRQSAAPTGWTKQVALNDYGLRVTSGAIGTVAGSAFSAVFAQSAVGNTTLDITAMPQHSHSVDGSIITTSAVAAAGHAFADKSNQNTSSVGGGGPHSHSVNLTLAYVDVIIATKN